MSQYPQTDYRDRVLGYATDEKSVASFFNTVYAWMCVGIAVTATVAWLVAQNAAIMATWVITYGIPIVFIGLTAYDTQKLRQIAVQVAGNSQEAARYAIVGSLHLYVDFINIFLAILRIMGSRR